MPGEKLGLGYEAYDLHCFRALRSETGVLKSLQPIPKSWNMALGGLVLGFPILDLKGMRIMMFQLSGFYYILLIEGLGFRPRI